MLTHCVIEASSSFTKSIVTTKTSTFGVSRSDAAFGGGAAMISLSKCPFVLMMSKRTLNHVCPNWKIVRSHECRQWSRLGFVEQWNILLRCSNTDRCKHVIACSCIPHVQVFGKLDMSSLEMGIWSCNNKVSACNSSYMNMSFERRKTRLLKRTDSGSFCHRSDALSQRKTGMRKEYK